MKLSHLARLALALAPLSAGCASAEERAGSRETATPSLSAAEGVAVSGGESPRDAPRRRDTRRPVAPPPSPASCEETEAAAACFVCCEQAHPAATKLRDDALRACACAPSRCAAAGCSGPYCAGTSEATSACLACIDAVFTECVAEVERACALDDACRALSACVDANRCAKKP